MSGAEDAANTLAYKVLTSGQMADLLAQGVFAGAPVDLADGYIHLSTAAQLPGTLAKHFAGQQGLHLAAVDLAACGLGLRWEVSRAGEDFPHLYAPLRLSEVVAHAPLTRDADGLPRLPA